MKKNFYITTPIYYVNDKPHIWSCIHDNFGLDVLARFNPRNGKRHFFLTGLDEHGQKVQQAAQNSGMSPKRTL